MLDQDEWLPEGEQYEELMKPQMHHGSDGSNGRNPYYAGNADATGGDPKPNDRVRLENGETLFDENVHNDADAVRLYGKGATDVSGQTLNTTNGKTVHFDAGNVDHWEYVSGNVLAPETGQTEGGSELGRHLSDFWDGVTDFPIQPAVTNSTVTSIGNLVANAAEKSGSIGGMVAGKFLGLTGIIMTMNSDIENHGHLTAGDWTKAGIGVALMLSPVGWATLGYAAIDLTIGITTGTSVTDRIGAGIDKTIDNW